MKEKTKEAEEASLTGVISDNASTDATESAIGRDGAATKAESVAFPFP